VSNPENWVFLWYPNTGISDNLALAIHALPNSKQMHSFIAANKNLIDLLSLVVLNYGLIPVSIARPFAAI
jgi:hypothetical protein